MKSRILLAAVGALWAVAISAAPARADGGWVITSFSATYRINPLSSINVIEDINVDFGSLPHHGIFRTIPYRFRYDSSRDRLMNVIFLSATDGTKPLPYTESDSGAERTIKIGDPNVTVTGPQRYLLSYAISGGMNAFSDHDELYWNVDGGAWTVPKQHVSAAVLYPSGAFQKAACYQGPSGSKEACTFQTVNDTVTTYASTRQLGPGEQMTIVTALNKGAVTVRPPILVAHEREFPQQAFDINPATVGVSALILLAGIGLIVRFWWQHGRDRAYLTHYYLTHDPSDHAAPLFQHDPVVVEFGPPQNLRPAELGLILDESADTKDVTATIVDLAVRGVLTIGEVQGRKDWIISWRPNQVTNILPFERTLLDGLFAFGRQQVALSALKGTFKPTLQATESQMYTDAMSRNFFTTRPDYLRTGRIVLGFVLLIVGALLTKWLGTSFGWGLPGLAVMLVGAVLIATFRLMSVRTAAGRDLMQHTLGFRMYMSTAEKYRQQFAEKAEIFTQLLPYAIVFGCVTHWAKAFEGIDTSRTDGWYVGSQPFQAVVIAGSLQAMNSSISSAISYSPGGSGASGFGGGGGAGGGGGGGGGGGW